jgi:adenylate kinase
LDDDESFLEEEDADFFLLEDDVFLLLDEDFLSVQSLQIEDDDSSISSESTALLQAVKNAKRALAIREAYFLENKCLFQRI